MSGARTLVLWRHAEAETGHGRPDRERRLTPRGLEQAAQAARQIAALDPRPGLLLHSSAPRAAQTAALGAAALALPASATRPVDELYLASPATLLAALAAALAVHGDGNRCVLLVGHNPGLSELGALLDPSRTGTALDTAGWWRVALPD